MDSGYIDSVIAAARPVIVEFEGCRLHAYPDPASHGEPWTIGFGHTGHVRSTDSITQEQAEHLLEQDMKQRLMPLLAHLKHRPSVNEAAALLSFCFNLGLGAFYHSTLLHKLNEGDMAGAADEFPKWCHAGGHVMKGLVRRREAERKLFLST